MALWNEKHIERPVFMTDNVSSKDIKPEICVLVITTNNMLSYFYSMKRFELAAAYTSRMSNVWKARYRLMPGFQKFRRITRTLRQIKSLNIAYDVLNFSGFLPEVSFIPTEVKLPVRSNVEFLLVRLQSLVKLFMRAVYLSKEVACYMLGQIASAHNFTQTSGMLALVSEIWVVTRGVIRQLNQFYTELHGTLPILPATGERWLPKGYNLPTSLAEWLGKEYEEEILRGSEEVSTDIREDSTIFSLLTHQDTEMKEVFEEMANIANITEEKEKHSFEPAIVSALPKVMLLDSIQSDTGLIVKRSAADRTDAPVNDGFAEPNLDHIRSKYHVKKFIESERANRAQNIKQAVTRKVSDANFNTFREKLMVEIDRISSAEFVSLFKKQFLHLISESGSRHLAKKSKKKVRNGMDYE